MAKHRYIRKTKSTADSYRSAITGRFVKSEQAPRRVTDEGIARLRSRGASEEFLNAAATRTSTRGC